MIQLTHIEDIKVVVDEVLDDLHLVFPFAVCLEEARGEEQRQVLGAHLIQVGTLLDPGVTGVQTWRE